MTYCETCHVSVVEGVVRLTEERHQSVTFAQSVSFSLANAGVRPHIVGIQNSKVILLSAEPLVIFTVYLHTNHGISAMLALLQVIGGNSIPHPLCPMLLLCLNSICRIGNGTLGNWIGKDTLLLLTIIETKGCLHIEVLERINIHISIAEHTPISIAVIAIAVETCQRVLTIRVTAHRTRIIAIDSANRQRRIELKNILKKTARCLHLTGAVDGEMLANCDNMVLADLQQLILTIHTSRETVEV